jgi:hypothetical protein
LRVRWFHAPLLYGLGVFLGTLGFDLAGSLRFMHAPALLEDPRLYVYVLLGAFILKPTLVLWILLTPATEALAGRVGNWAALLPLLTGVGLALLGLLVVLPGILASITG